MRTYLLFGDKRQSHCWQSRRVHELEKESEDEDKKPDQREE